MSRSALFLSLAIFASPAAAANPPAAKTADKESEARALLCGTWQLSADDGRAGSLRLDPDGSLHAESTRYSERAPDYKGHWYLLDVTEKQFTLEFGSAPGSPDSYQVTLLFTCPDAFTLVQTCKGQDIRTEQQRFVRLARAP